MVGVSPPPVFFLMTASVCSGMMKGGWGGEGGEVRKGRGKESPCQARCAESRSF